MISTARFVLAAALIATPWHLSAPQAAGDRAAGERYAQANVFRPTSKPPQPSPAPPTAEDWGNALVDIAYREPADAQFRPIRERLMKRKVLEQLRLFLSPLKLPRRLMVQIDQCNVENRAYEPGGPVTICYEYIARVEQIAITKSQPGGIPSEVMIVGAFVQAVLHQVSLAVFDVFEIPVWGREYDAADKLAGFIMVQFGRDVALRVLIGAAYFFEVSDRTWTGTDFASVQSPEAQRLFNYLCIAYGADPATFKFLVDQGILPARRAGRCALEFFGLRAAFQKEILPHVDQALLRKVQAATWLMLDEPR